MLPPIGPRTHSLLPPTSTVAARLRQETAQRVDPAGASTPRIGPKGDVTHLLRDLIPPDPNAPTGPPPAFDSSPLDRAREASRGHWANRPDRSEGAAAASERAAAGLEETRRLNAPPGARAVDVVR